MIENIQVLENGVTIYWHDTTTQTAPRAANPNRIDSYVAVSCPGCGGKRYVRKHNALNANLCKNCHASKMGSISYRKLIARVGKAQAQQTILKNCNTESWAETLIAGWLEHDGFSFKRHVIFDTNPLDEFAPWFVLDFQLRWGNAAIEVNGWGHKLPHVKARDARLAQHWGGALLTITTEELRADEIATRRKVREFCTNVLFDAWMK